MGGEGGVDTWVWWLGLEWLNVIADDDDVSLKTLFRTDGICKIKIKYVLRARPKAKRVLVEYEDFLSLSDPTDPTRPGRFSASYIFWTKLPIGKWFSPSESHIQ